MERLQSVTSDRYGAYCFNDNYVFIIYVFSHESKIQKVIFPSVKCYSGWLQPLIDEVSTNFLHSLGKFYTPKQKYSMRVLSSLSLVAIEMQSVRKVFICPITFKYYNKYRFKISLHRIV